MIRRQEGQTIVEVLLAATVVAVALTALVAIVTSTLAQNRNAQNRVIATRQAQEAIELIRASRDAYGTWDNFETQQLKQLNPTSPIIMCLINPVPDYDIWAGTTSTPQTVFIANDCTNHTYAISNNTFTRKVTIAYTTSTPPPPRAATITVVVSWYAGNRPDSVTETSVLNERD